VDGNTHEVNVYKDGSLDPETFQIFLANEIDNDGSYLGMGLSSGSRAGGVDLDFIAYKEGIHPPEPPGGVDGDFNNDGKVDAADYVVWRKNNGGGTALPNDGGLGTPIGAAHYNLWRGNFGDMSPGSGSVVGAIPEPSSAILLSMATIVFGVLRRCGTRRVRP
jgi:hypothetical protein